MFSHVFFVYHPFAEANMFCCPLLILKGIDFTTENRFCFSKGRKSKWKLPLTFCSAQVLCTTAEVRLLTLFLRLKSLWLVSGAISPKAPSYLFPSGQSFWHNPWRLPIDLGPGCVPLKAEASCLPFQLLIGANSLSTRRLTSQSELTDRSEQLKVGQLFCISMCSCFVATSVWVSHVFRVDFTVWTFLLGISGQPKGPHVV